MRQASGAPRPSLVEVPDGPGMPDFAKRAQAQPIVMVLGMHRSGTSLCSHVLSVLGVATGAKSHTIPPTWGSRDPPGKTLPCAHILLK